MPTTAAAAATDNSAIPEFCPNLDSLSVRLSGGVSKLGVEAAVKGCRKLKVLGLGWTKATLGCAHYIAEHCGNLEVRACRPRISS
jgi:hypothetical protein